MSQWWKTDNDMFTVADLVASKVLELYDKENITLSDPDPGPVSRLFREDAAKFIRLDPQVLIEEHERVLDVTERISAAESDEVNDLIEETKHNLSDWEGDAARAFRSQLNRIETFTNVQQGFVLKLTEAFYVKIAVAAQVRADYCTLAQATVDTLEKAIADAEDRTTEFRMKLFAGVAKTVLGGAKSGADAGIDIAVDGMLLMMTGAELEEIMKGYNQNVSRLLEAYFSELEEVQRIVDSAQKRLLETEFSLFEPLPGYVDVSGPDFRYENFFPDSDPDKRLGPQVEEERRKHLDEQSRLTNPDSPIHRRLAGEGE